MKNIFAIILLAGAVCFASVANAQRGYTTTLRNGAFTITAADTTNMLNIEGGVVQFEYNATETSGTTAGKIYLEGRMFSSWVKLDSVSLTDVATIQTLRYFPTKTYYKDYRFINTNTSSSTQTILAGYIRRPGVDAPAPNPMPIASGTWKVENGKLSVRSNAWRNSFLIKYHWKGREVIVRRSFVIV
jgi:hypothetical protein